MKKTREMFAKGFYLLEGRSSANSSFIEDKEEALKFILTCNKKLEGYLIIHDFLICQDGWQLLVEILDEESIMQLYIETRKGSRKAKPSCRLDVIWKIISDQMRSIISNFVVYTNKKNGRTGSKVLRSYERYWFESLEEGQKHLDEMRGQLIKMSQRLRKYRSRKLHYRISKKEGKAAIFLCSKHIIPGLENLHFGSGCMSLIGNKVDVLRQLINFTISSHLVADDQLSHRKLE